MKPLLAIFILICTTVFLLTSCTTTQNTYRAEYYYEKAAFSPNDSPDAPVEDTLSRLCIKSSDGRYWEIDLDFPTTLNLEATLGDIENGFYLVYKEEYGVERLFFKEKHGEPYLYEIETSFYYDGIWTTSRKIKPPVKISKLTAEKICSLLEKEDIK